VAGLECIAKSKKLGSDVRAWDVRDVSDQAASLGASWVKVDFKEEGAGAGGYAKESSKEFQAKQLETFENELKTVDIALCTAAIPGAQSPLLITKKAVAGMKPGSVIVDLAAVGGGNCELTKAGETIVTDNKVIIIGYTDMTSRMAYQASAMYGQNMVNFLKYVHGKTGSTTLLKNIEEQLGLGDEGDIIPRSIVCCKGGKLVTQPPPPQPTALKKPEKKKVEKQEAEPNPLCDGFKNALAITITVCVLMGMGKGTSVSLLASFLLAGAAGYQAVWGVKHALHTPLMSVTNAISGLTAVGGLLLLEKVSTETDIDVGLARWLAITAIGISSVNIVGGFIVSQRMLNLFRKGGEVDYSWMMIAPAIVLGYYSLMNSDDEKIDGTVSTISGVLCVAAIVSLASMSTADMGCKFGMVGVFGAVISTIVQLSPSTLELSLSAMGGGGAVGLAIGCTVSPMKLPQTVAAFHSLVGAAATCTSIGSFYEAHGGQPGLHAGVTTENLSAIFGNVIGAVTLTGSLVAFGKLNGNLGSKELHLPGKNFLNVTLLGAIIGLGYQFLTNGNGFDGILWLTALAGVACVLGFHLVSSVGGGDMPVCVTVLNSYSGWALVAEGFLLKSPILTVVGSLIGCSGAILTKIMCDAMNRDIMNVIFGGLNTVAKVGGSKEQKEHRTIKADQVAEAISQAKSVIVVPGYGMAQARAQGPVGELAKVCRENDIEFKFGIHPVAGRMPGQMNVLLAEAGVPHEWVFEMDEVNPIMDTFDVAMCVGSNDIVNSAAQEPEFEGCAIWGMPVLEVWRAERVFFSKRSMAAGYADLENPVFFKPNTEMFLGSADKTMPEVVTKLRELLKK
jgi:NAD(P) transhydrogenase